MEDCWKYILYEYDKMVLQSADWLNDKLIHASEQLLKQQHPRIFGLQDPILQITSTLEIMGNKEFVQILHHGQNHWITISTVGCSSNTVHVYDSLNLPFTKDLEAIVADLLFTNNTHITKSNISVEQTIAGFLLLLQLVPFAMGIIQLNLSSIRSV